MSWMYSLWPLTKIEKAESKKGARRSHVTTIFLHQHYPFRTDVIGPFFSIRTAANTAQQRHHPFMATIVLHETSLLL